MPPHARARSLILSALNAVAIPLASAAIPSVSYHD